MFGSLRMSLQLYGPSCISSTAYPPDYRDRVCLFAQSSPLKPADVIWWSASKPRRSRSRSLCARAAYRLLLLQVESLCSHVSRRVCCVRVCRKALAPEKSKVKLQFEDDPRQAPVEKVSDEGSEAAGKLRVSSTRTHKAVQRGPIGW